MTHEEDARMFVSRAVSATALRAMIAEYEAIYTDPETCTEYLLAKGLALELDQINEGEMVPQDQERLADQSQDLLEVAFGQLEYVLMQDDTAAREAAND